MKKIILLLPIILGISCAENPIILDEEKLNAQAQSQSSETLTVNDFEKRNTLVKANDGFNAQDIQEIEVFEDAELVGTGLRTYSSASTKEIIKQEKQNNQDLAFIVYFEFNSNDLDDEAMQIINAHKAILDAYPDLGIRLEGHTDPKGSREYNLALGELRTLSVKDTLKDDATYVSFGEEKIVSTDDAKNRRVEIIYK